ncbi:MAG: hypothetical protein ABWJ42_04665 [Sulfolobales archaeon]
MVNRLTEEIIGASSRKSFLHEENMVLVKLLYLVFVVASFFTKNIFIELIIVLLNVLLFLVIRFYRTLLFTLLIWLGLAATIIPIDLIARTLDERVFFNLLYGYSTLTTISLFYITTPPAHLRRLLGLNTLTLAYTLLRSFLLEIIEIVDTYRVRGLDLGIIYLHRYASIIYTSLNVALLREDILRNSLRARGLDID